MENTVKMRKKNWRIERQGPPGPDGKGRYWIMRRGSGKDRESGYGGKINFEIQ